MSSVSAFLYRVTSFFVLYWLRFVNYVFLSFFHQVIRSLFRQFMYLCISLGQFVRYVFVCVDLEFGSSCSLYLFTYIFLVLFLPSRIRLVLCIQLCMGQVHVVSLFMLVRVCMCYFFMSLCRSFFSYACSQLFLSFCTSVCVQSSRYLFMGVIQLFLQLCCSSVSYGLISLCCVFLYVYDVCMCFSSLSYVVIYSCMFGVRSFSMIYLCFSFFLQFARCYFVMQLCIPSFFLHVFLQLGSSFFISLSLSLVRDVGPLLSVRMYVINEFVMYFVSIQFVMSFVISPYSSVCLSFCME